MELSPLQFRSRFARFSWALLGLNLAVIAWGAYVRASGSGAGCGAHWPLCNGDVIPRAERVQTVVEFAHRASSGGALVLVIAMAIAAYRAFPKGSSVRRGATAAAVFMIFEAAIGAGLVLLRLVEHDASVLRAISISLHLANTFLLLTALTLTAWWASGGAPLRVRGRAGAFAMLSLALVGVMLVGTSGAVAALGDTLFPSSSLASALAQDLSPGAHIFIRLRLLHPFFAAITAAIVLTVASIVRVTRGRSSRVRVASYGVTALVFTQVGAGLLNVALRAPIWMQLVHLLLADGTWIAIVLLCATTLADEAPAPRACASAGSALLGLDNPAR